MLRPFILGTAGHIDHGKSTLVKALTGADPDRLPEEKQRGMTIELGFAHFELTDPEEPGIVYSLGVVDVPGHADLIRNMLAGIAGIDLALFVVAADDGWMPQSEEHLQILTYLDIDRGVVVLTKSDLAEDLDFSVEMLREELRGTILEHAAIVPVSVPHDRGLDDLRTALAAVLREAPAPLDIGKPRLHVDRAFSPTGVGTVVTGTLTGGSLAGGKEVVIQPLGLPAHIRGVQSHHSQKDHARPGMRTALNLPEVPLAGPEKKSGVARGDVVTLSTLGAPSLTVDVILQKSAREIPGQSASSRPLRTGQRVRVHHGSATHEARLHLLDSRSLGTGESLPAELRLVAPMHAFAGDRVILRDWSKQFTVAGGIVLDPDGRRRDFRKSAQRAFLAALAAAPADAPAAVRAHLRRDRALRRDSLLIKSRFSEAEVRQAAESLVKSKAAVHDAGWLLEAAWWNAVTDRAAGAIEDHHREHPETEGLSLRQLRVDLASQLPDPRLFDLLVAQLAARTFTREGDFLRTGGHRASLPPHLAEAGERLRGALAANPFDPPNPKELAPTPDDQKALKFLCQTGEAIQLSEKAVLSRASHDRLRSLIIESLASRGRATASELRDATGTSRRFLIPLLERLDKEGLTRRDGDYRSLKSGLPGR